jgi:hypothetical protein
LPTSARHVRNGQGDDGHGRGIEGDNRAIEAAEKAIANPLLDGVSMKGAKGVIVSITGGEDMRLLEVDEAANHIKDLVDPMPTSSGGPPSTTIWKVGFACLSSQRASKPRRARRPSLPRHTAFRRAAAQRLGLPALSLPQALRRHPLVRLSRKRVLIFWMRRLSQQLR